MLEGSLSTQNILIQAILEGTEDALQARHGQELSLS
jgi:hypothetical protein